jgi:death-on-curing protein
VRFPTLDELVELHEQILDQTGGARGILNLGTVAAALDRAQHGPFWARVDLADRAALLLRGICQDHPFADGNKRTAFEAVDELFARNGVALEAAPAAVVSFMLSVAQGLLSLDDIAAWLRTHSRNPNGPEGGEQVS